MQTAVEQTVAEMEASWARKRKDEDDDRTRHAQAQPWWCECEYPLVCGEQPCSTTKAIVEEQQRSQRKREAKGRRRLRYVEGNHPRGKRGEMWRVSSTGVIGVLVDGWYRRHGRGASDVARETVAVCKANMVAEISVWRCSVAERRGDVNGAIQTGRM